MRPDSLYCSDAVKVLSQVADERQSCVIKVSTNPIHIISQSPTQRICGRESQPWTVESPTGQRIKVTLIDFNNNTTRQGNRQSCNSYGTIADRAANRNESICGGRGQRQRKIYTSVGNSLEIYLHSVGLKESEKDNRKFIFYLEAVGCSDIIPSEETWLRRKDDVIVIGCYSTQQTWQLNCNEGKWIGVLGNCSTTGLPVQNKKELQEVKSKISDQEEVLAIVAISGCTFVICLVIVCVGAICLRRFYFRYKSQQDYKTLSLGRNPDINQHLIQGIPSDSIEANEQRSYNNSKQMPTYFVYAADNDFSDKSHNATILNNVSGQ